MSDKECKHEWRCIQDDHGDWDFFFYCIHCKKIEKISHHIFGEKEDEE